MCDTGAVRHDGPMTDDTSPPQDPGPGTSTVPDPPGTESSADDPNLDAARLRTLVDVQRPVDDRLLAGVCTGVARHLDIDPVVVRIGFAVLTFIGGAGVVLYAGAWLLLPTTEDPSPAARWFRLNENEAKVRSAGLVASALIAVLVAVDDGGVAGNDWGAPWFLLPLALLAYVFVIRPRRRREIDGAPTESPVHTGLDTVRRKGERPPRSGALTVLTLSITAIAIAVTRLVADRSDGSDGTPWTIYVVVALLVVALGVLVSTFVGDGGLLIVIGIVLAIILGLGTLLPSARVGELRVAPTTAADLSPSYEHGVGQVTVDLTSVTDPEALLGRTLGLRAGVGQTTVVVPDGLNVAVRTELGLGQVQVFDRMVNGTSNELDLPADAGRRLTVDVQQGVGDIEVVRR